MRVKNRSIRRWLPVRIISSRGSCTVLTIKSSGFDILDEPAQRQAIDERHDRIGDYRDGKSERHDESERQPHDGAFRARRP